VELGPWQAVFQSPVHPYTKALLSSFPTLTGKRSDLVPIPGETPNLIRPPTGCRFCDRCPEAQTFCKTTPPHWVDIGSEHKALCCKS
jgi:peptide/nickel transport system ATP-binding protein